MKSTFKFRGAATELEIDPARISKEFAQIEGARTVMGRRARGDQALADRAIARWIMDAVEHNGAKWTARAAAALDTMHSARENLSAIFDSVVNGEIPPVDKVLEEMGKLDKSFEILKSPEKDLVSGRVEAPPQRDLANPIADFTFKSAIADQNKAFGALSESQKGMLQGLAETDGSTLRKAIVAETREGHMRNLEKLKERLTNQGKKADEVNAAIEAIEGLSKSWRGEAASRLPPDHILQMAKAVGELPSERMRAAVLADASGTLGQLAHSNPEILKAMWEAYEAKGTKYPFSNYVAYIQRQRKGLVGEYTLAFDLGEGIILLKGPDAKVTIPGTDAVALNLKTGEVLLLDNKSLKSADALDAVGALTRNLPKNIAVDAGEFQAKFGYGPETPIEVAGAVKRIKEASDAIHTITAGMSKEKISTESVQKLIDAELKKRNITRAVANAGGNTAALSARLQRIGMSLLDVNKPLAE